MLEGELLATYAKRYQSALQLEHQPSEATRNLLIGRLGRKSVEFAQLSKVTNTIDGRDSYNKPMRLGKHLSINLDGALKRELSDFNASTAAFARGARVLMMGYVLVSATDTTRP